MPTSSRILDSEWNKVYGQDSGFRDPRRLKSFNWLSERFKVEQSCVINAITNNESERKKAERIINNSHIDISESIEHCCLPVDYDGFAGKDILNIIDETRISFADAVGRMPDRGESMGVIGNGLHYGQNCVAGLVVQRDGLKTLGLGSLIFYSWDANATPARDRIGQDNRPFQYRGSEKWIESALQAEVRAPQAKRLIHVADREADNVNFIAKLFPSTGSRPDSASANSHIVIRAKEDRFVHPEGDKTRSEKIRDLLAKEKPVACYSVEVPDDERMSYSADYAQKARKRVVKRVKKRQGRRAMLEIKSLSCQLDGEKILSGKSGVKKKLHTELLNQSAILEQALTYVQVRELDEQGRVLKGNESSKDEQSIDWLILTTLPVTNASDAFGIVDIYRQRFPLIEQLFRCLKTDGFNIEKAQQQSLKALQLVTAIAMKSSALIMKMIGARDKDEGYAIEDDFAQKEIEILALCLERYQGSTIVQTNHHPTSQLSWAVWIIARMEGWKPENKKRPPSPKTLQRGLDKFYAVYEGAALAKGWPPKDVSQP